MIYDGWILLNLLIDRSKGKQSVFICNDTSFLQKNKIMLIINPFSAFFRKTFSKVLEFHDAPLICCNSLPIFYICNNYYSNV